jgi:HEAT repeat protein
MQMINLKLSRRPVSDKDSGMKEKTRSRIDSLRPLLKDPVPGVRSAAAEAIEKLEAASGVDDILATLKTGSMGARIGAIYALGEIGGDKVLPPLVYCARRPEVDIRSAAVAVLGNLALPAVLPVLIELLVDENSTVQGRAIAALRNYSPSPDVLKKLRSFLGASDGVLEAEAAMTLACLKDQHSLEQIHALLASAYASTRQAAATALSIMPLQ